MAGCGQIRLFLTMVMVEVTGQIVLVPYVCLAAMASVACASQISDHGLYHALLHAAHLPYLEHERPHDDDAHAHAGGEASSSASSSLSRRGSSTSAGLYPTWFGAPIYRAPLVSDVMSAPLIPAS